MNTHRIGDVTVLSDVAETPGLGFLPVNAFVLHSEQPLVIDTGLSTPNKEFVSALAEVLDPAEVQWMWITQRIYVDRPRRETDVPLTPSRH